MSKIALQGNASGTGTLTIAAPNTNSNYTIDLPAGSGTLVTTGGAQTIEFATGTVSAPGITFTGDTNTGIYSPAADTIAFTEGGTEAMRITSAGEVLVGGTTAIESAPSLSIQGTNVAGALSLFRNDTTVVSGDNLGQVNFYGNDTTSNTPTRLAYVSAVASGTHAAGDNPTDLVFGVTTDNTATVTEEMRLTSEGALAFGGAANYGTAGQVLTSQGNASPTWTTLSSGGVTSLNGQTGAITDTGFGDIGSYATFLRAISAGSVSRTTIGSTYAGSTLRYNYTLNSVNTDFNGAPALSGSAYSAGGSAPSGTWRAVGRDWVGPFSCQYYWNSTMYVRVS